MNLKDIIERNRSYRRFDNKRRITSAELFNLVENATKVASAANLQNIKFVVSNCKKTNDEIFRCLNWAGYLSEWQGPIAEERPSAYILMLTKSSIEKYAHFDAGIAAQTITLSATEMGLGACLIASFNKSLLNSIIDVSEDEYSILLCIALGKPAEKVLIEPVIDNNIQYWRDNEGVHHVPKRNTDEVMLCSFLDND